MAHWRISPRTALAVSHHVAACQCDVQQRRPHREHAERGTDHTAPSARPENRRGARADARAQRARQMMRLSLFVSLSWLAIATIVSACGGGAPPTITPASQAPKITLTTNPNPPTSGEVEVIAMVTDANGQPLDAAEVFVFGNHT